jgi:hypothetical protein
MKTNKIFSLLIASLTLVFSACEPIVDTAELSNTTDVAGVELEAIQSGSSGSAGNLIELRMLTPGIIGYWDYNIGTAFSDKAKFIETSTGIKTYSFTGTLGKEFFTKTIDVQIDVLDTALEQDYYSLVSDDTATGKTWVFYAAQPWYMSNPTNYAEQWWDAWTCCLADPNGKMKFDLNGGSNYTYYSDANSAGQLGKFKLSIVNQTLVVSGAPILGGQDGGRLPGNGVFDIISLTDTEMILHTEKTVAGDSGWTWKFVAE